MLAVRSKVQVSVHAACGEISCVLAASHQLLISPQAALQAFHAQTSKFICRHHGLQIGIYKHKCGTVDFSSINTKHAMTAISPQIVLNLPGQQQLRLQANALISQIWNGKIGGPGTLSSSFRQHLHSKILYPKERP